MNINHFILHLTLIDDIGPATIQKIIKLQRSGISVSDLYFFSVADWQYKAELKTHSAQKLVKGLANKKNFDEELVLIERNKVNWMTIDDGNYPSLLREIYLPPMVIYWQGASIQDSKHYNKTIAVVGSRKADNYAERVIDCIIPDLVAADYTIVSGGACGVDTLAHKATLKAGGKTIAVLGSGLLQPYPLSNKALFKMIIDGGGSVVSSFPLRMQPFQGNFPARNRIITGLSRGCLVVQAAQKSGALISARYALEQGREVFAVPGLFDHELSIGCNVLIQQGAKLVMTSADILQEFGDRVITSLVVKTEQKQLIDNSIVTDKYAHYSIIQKHIIDACKIPSYFDSIVNSTNLSVESVQSALFNLQLEGVIEQDFAGMWKLL